MDKLLSLPIIKIFRRRRTPQFRIPRSEFRIKKSPSPSGKGLSLSKKPSFVEKRKMAF